MNKLILFTILLFIIFCINIIFYFLSDDYRLFLKGAKNGTIIESVEPDNDLKIDQQNIESIKTNSKSEEYFRKNSNTEKVELKNEIVLGDNYLDILKLFYIYNLDKLEVNSSLFDITDEYPDKYFEYYSPDLILYLFPTKNYSDIVDIFNVLEMELPIMINKVNNFGNNSFYINLDSDIDDSFVRIIIENKGIVFGLKIKKTEYNLVKEKLNSLKK